MRDLAADGYVRLSEPGETCDKCSVERERWSRPSGDMEFDYCPCCRSRVRRAEVLEREFLARAEAEGITPDELHEQIRAQIGPQPEISPEAMRGLKKMVSRHAAEWTPACEHDTKNPWAANSQREPS